MNRLSIIIAIFLSLFVRNVNGQTYQIIDLGTLGGMYSYAWGINASGQVVGESGTTNNGYDHAFLYSNGSMHDISVGPNSTYSYAHGINDNGQVVGRTSINTGSNNGTYAFLYSNGVVQYLGSLGFVDSIARAINSSGQIVGDFNDRRQTWTHAFLYSNGIMKDLGTLGGYISFACAINDNGQVVGSSDLVVDGPLHAFLYSNSTMQDLNIFLDSEDVYAKGINNSGQVTGYTWGDNGYSAYVYSNGIVHVIGSNTLAFGINNSGQVVGWFYPTPSESRAFLYSNGVMSDLNNMIDPASGWTLKEAFGINDSGQIAGYGINGLGQEHAILLNPISLPIITVHPKSQSAIVGSTVRLSVSVTYSPYPFVYQWYFGTNTIDWATNGVLVLTNIQPNQSGAYSVTVSNQTGRVTSAPAMISVLPGLGINMVPAIIVAGQVGLNYELDYVNVFGPTNAWVPLATITVTNNPQYYFDVSAIGQPSRFYRLVQVP